jgi:hypothetical protein
MIIAKCKEFNIKIYENGKINGWFLPSWPCLPLAYLSPLAWSW